MNTTKPKQRRSRPAALAGLILVVAFGVLAFLSLAKGIGPTVPFIVLAGGFVVGIIAIAESARGSVPLIIVLAAIEIAWGFGLREHSQPKNADKSTDFAANASLLYAEPYKLYTKESANKNSHYKGNSTKYLRGDSTFDWKAVFSENDGVTIGENHVTTSAVDFLIANLAEMKSNGLNAVFIELTPIAYDYLKKFDPPEGVAGRIFVRRRDDRTFALLEKACGIVGIPLVPYDIDPEHVSTSDMGMAERNRGMAQAVTKIESYLWEDAGRRLKFVTLNGARHIGRGRMSPPTSLNDFLACYGIRTLAVDIDTEAPDYYRAATAAVGGKAPSDKPDKAGAVVSKKPDADIVVTTASMLREPNANATDANTSSPEMVAKQKQ